MRTNTPAGYHSSARRCSLCGDLHHPAEGPCDCAGELEPCPCGQCLWEKIDGEIECWACRGAPGEEGG